MDAFPNVVHFLFDEFPGLCRWRFALAFVGLCSRECLLFGHRSPGRQMLMRQTYPPD
jgi:hypothetical protein